MSVTYSAQSLGPTDRGSGGTIGDGHTRPRLELSNTTCRGKLTGSTLVDGAVGRGPTGPKIDRGM